jgi:cell division protein FtsB
MSGTRGRRLGFGTYLGIVAVLATLSALDPSGLRKYTRLRGETVRMQEENARLAAETARLASEVRALRVDPGALARAAREDLGLVGPGERVYHVAPRDGASP